MPISQRLTMLVGNHRSPYVRVCTNSALLNFRTCSLCSWDIAKNSLICSNFIRTDEKTLDYSPAASGDSLPTPKPAKKATRANLGRERGKVATCAAHHSPKLFSPEERRERKRRTWQSIVSRMTRMTCLFASWFTVDRHGLAALAMTSWGGVVLKNKKRNFKTPLPSTERSGRTRFFGTRQYRQWLSSRNGCPRHCGHKLISQPVDHPS